MESLYESIHTEDMQDIVTTPPSWLLRWGISLVLLVLCGILGMSAFVEYPDTVISPVKINTANAPKAIVSHVAGNISKLLVREGDWVKKGQDLAWMESTANHGQVMNLIADLLAIRELVDKKETTKGIRIDAPDFMELGELQQAYQTFYQSYIGYRSSVERGLYIRQEALLLEEMSYEKKKLEKLIEQQAIQDKSYQIAQEQYNAYKILADKKVISRMEMKEQESLFLASQQPLQQIQSAIISSKAGYVSKEKELAGLKNQILSEQAVFLQSLNGIISEAMGWKRNYVLASPQAGQIVFAHTLQDYQYVEANKPLFYVNTGSEDFFCEMYVRQENAGKIRKGQKAWIRMHSYPYQEYGELEGKVMSISPVPYQDTLFLSNVALLVPKSENRMELKVGMLGNGSVLVEKRTLLDRLVGNVRKALTIRK